MNDLFLFTAANPEAQRHLVDSIANPIQPSLVAGTAAAALLDVTVDAEDARCWGATPGPSNRARWERMQAGDACLIYGGGGEFSRWGQVLDKVHDPVAAEGVRGANEAAETWEYMYFLEVGDFSPPVPVSQVASDAGYEPAWRPQGFMYFSEEAVRNITAANGSTAAWIYGLGAGVSTGGGPSTPPATSITRPFKPSMTRPVKLSSNYSGPDPDVVGRGVNAHRQLVNGLGDAVSASGFHPKEPKAPAPNYDLSWQAGSETWIVEAKSLTAANETHQLRLGLGQLLEFLYVASTLPPASTTYRGALVVEREPTEAAKWMQVCRAVGVELAWPGSLSGLGV